MTSHTPQPPAGDDLVARLRAGICVAPSLTGDGSHIDIPATERLLAEAAEALTQQTEPVAGEVERYGLIALPDGSDRMLPRELGPWIRYSDHRSSYDALAAAKARAEEEYLRAWNERDAQRRRAEAAEDLITTKDATIAECERQFQEQVQRTIDEMCRAEETERQRDALREAMKPFAPESTETMEDILWSEFDDDTPCTLTIKVGDIRRARAALKGVRP